MSAPGSGKRAAELHQDTQWTDRANRIVERGPFGDPPARPGSADHPLIEPEPGSHVRTAA